jgi:hypothetical protein
MTRFNPFDQTDITCTNADVESIGEPSREYDPSATPDEKHALDLRDFDDFLYDLSLKVYHEWGESA